MGTNEVPQTNGYQIKTMIPTIECTKDTVLIAVQKALDVLQKGGLVVVPSDTVYGLSVDGTNKKAVEKLIAFKSRPTGKPISVFVHDIDRAQRIVDMSDIQRTMLDNMLPGSFTLILPSKHVVDKHLESEKETLGIRIINHPFISQLTHVYKNPITATSANLSGGSPHYSIDSLLDSLSIKKKEMIDLVIDYGQLAYNKPSTVIDISQDEISVLRKGDMGVGEKREYVTRSEDETKKIAVDLIERLRRNENKKPLVLVLQGELGVGKTQFVKGIGHFLGINDIISPTFVIYYEYDIPNEKKSKFYHVDLYNISQKDEFEHLGFDQMLALANVICIEWGEKSGEIISMLKKKAQIVFVHFSNISENEREIVVTS